MGEFDEYAPSEFDEYADGGAAHSAKPYERSFLGEVAHRTKEFGKTLAAVPGEFVEAVKNIPSTSPARIKENARIAFGPIVGAAEDATRAAIQTAAHPVDTVTNPAARREALRGANSLIPFANLAVERAGGPPENSPEDASAAPGFRPLGMVAVGAVPQAAPLVGRGLARVANAAQDATAATSGAIGEIAQGSVNRAARRAAEGGGHPVREAIGKSAEKLLEHGHGSLTAHAARAGAVAVDEKIAAIARRLGIKPQAVAEAAATEQVATTAEMSPAMRQYHDALATASPADKKWIEQAIAGLREKEARPARPTPRVEEPDVDFDIEEAPVATRRPPQRAPETAQAPPDTALARRQAAPEAEAEYIAPGAAPSATASTVDVEPVRQRAVGGAREPLALPAQKQQVKGTVGAPWEPSAADAKFAQQLGMSVDDYRSMMARSERRLGRSPQYDDAVQRLAKAARAATDADTFVKEASGAGLPEADARRIFEVAHPPKRRGRGRAKAAVSAEAAE